MLVLKLNHLQFLLQIGINADLTFVIVVCVFNCVSVAGSAVGFKLDSLLKLSDTRARNNKMTLMHYLCKVWLLNFKVSTIYLGQVVKLAYCWCPCLFVFCYWSWWMLADFIIVLESLAYFFMLFSLMLVWCFQNLTKLVCCYLIFDIDQCQIC